MTNFQIIVNRAAAHISSGRRITRTFDGYFEWYGASAVALALYRRAEKRPDTKLAQNLYIYLCEHKVNSDVQDYGHWTDLDALCEHLRSKST